MPSRRTHDRISLGVAALVELVAPTHEDTVEKTICRIAGRVLGAVGGGRAPDWIEPATSPNHRGTAHSLTTAVGMGTLVVKTLSNASTPTDGGMGDALARGLAETAPAGYLGHQVADATTPRGLPFG